MRTADVIAMDNASASDDSFGAPALAPDCSAVTLADTGLCPEITLVRAAALPLATHSLTVSVRLPAVASPTEVNADEDEAYVAAVCGRRMLNVYYEDVGLMVVHKPSNMLIDGVEHSVEEFLKRTYAGKYMFHLVHQIDYATSGVMVLALNKDAASGACRLFRERRVSKMYTAVVRGWVENDVMTITLPIADDNDHAGHRMRVVPESGCPFMPSSIEDCKKSTRPANTVVHAIRRGYLKPGSRSCSLCSYARAELGASRSRVLEAVRLAATSAGGGDSRARIQQAARATEDFLRIKRAFEFPTAMEGGGTSRPNEKLQNTTTKGNDLTDLDDYNCSVLSCTCCRILDSRTGCSDGDNDTNAGSDSMVPVTLVNLELCTGRRHQLRVHLAAVGHPIVGDPLYEAVPPFGSAYYTQTKAPHHLRLPRDSPLCSQSQTTLAMNDDATDSTVASLCPHMQLLNMGASQLYGSNESIFDSGASPLACGLAGHQQSKKQDVSDATSNVKQCIKLELRAPLGWDIKSTLQHRMLLHSEYILLQLHKVRKMSQWRTIDLTARIPSGFEDLVICICDLRSSACECSNVFGDIGGCVKRWESEHREGVLTDLREYERQKVIEAQHCELNSRRRQTAAFQHALFGLTMAYDSASTG